MENDILKHRKAVQENILKSFGVEVSEDMLEKAHNHGDVHSNGKWYWESSANGGKGDWRTIKEAGKAAPATNSAKPQPKAEEKKEDDKKSANPLGFKVGDTAIWDEKANKVTLHTKVLIVDLNEKTDTAKIKAPKDRGTFTVSISALKLPKKKNSDGSYTLEANGKKVKSDDKKKSEKSSYESEKADAYDKGDGKVGNYSVPTHTSYPAANLYSRLNNNRHFGFKHGLPVKEIMEKLKDYKGNVNVSYHNNAGTSEIYRIKFL